MEAEEGVEVVALVVLLEVVASSQALEEAVSFLVVVVLLEEVPSSLEVVVLLGAVLSSLVEVAACLEVVHQDVPPYLEVVPYQVVEGVQVGDLREVALEEVPLGAHFPFLEEEVAQIVEHWTSVMEVQVVVVEAEQEVLDHVEA